MFFYFEPYLIFQNSICAFLTFAWKVLVTKSYPLVTNPHVIFGAYQLFELCSHGRYYATLFLEKAIVNNAVKEHMCHHCVYWWHSNFRYRTSAFTTVPSSIVHYNDVIMSAMASQITSLTIVYSTVYSDANQRKHQSSASLAFVGEFTGHRWIPRIKGQ